MTPDDNNQIRTGAIWQLKAITEALGDLTLDVSDSLSIGRGQDNDVVLGSKAVSRNHAVLSVLNDELYIKDLGSSNGTFINGTQIESNQSELLHSDDRISFASFEFQVMPQSVSDNDSQMIHDMFDEPSDKPSDQPLNEPTPATSPVDAEPDLTADEPITTTEPTAEPKAAPSTDAQPVDSQTLDATPITREPIVTEADEAKPIKDEPVTSKPLTDEPVASKPLADEPVSGEPLTHKQAAHQEEVVTPEHDKTTKTALQEEADPEVLRAKQAATAQFSGTANLGKDRDVGTEGNNAMDQAITEAERHQHPEKKPSGSWFIWVFIAIIIIALALWLFNMGGVS